MGTESIDAFRRGLGEAIQLRRKRAGMTQEQLAEAAGTSTEWVSQVERGIGMPSIELLLRLTDALQADLIGVLHAASDPRIGRAVHQQLVLLLPDLDERDLRVLLAAASAMAESGV